MRASRRRPQREMLLGRSPAPGRTWRNDKFGGTSTDPIERILGRGRRGPPLAFLHPARTPSGHPPRHRAGGAGSRAAVRADPRDPHRSALRSCLSAEGAAGRVHAFPLRARLRRASLLGDLLQAVLQLAGHGLRRHDHLSCLRRRLRLADRAHEHPISELPAHAGDDPLHAAVVGDGARLDHVLQERPHRRSVGRLRVLLRRAAAGLDRLWTDPDHHLPVAALLRLFLPLGVELDHERRQPA